MARTGYNCLITASPNSNQASTVTYALYMTRNAMLFLAERR